MRTRPPGSTICVRRSSATRRFARNQAYPLAARLFIGGLKNLLAGVTTVAHHNPCTASAAGSCRSAWSTVRLGAFVRARAAAGRRARRAGRRRAGEVSRNAVGHAVHGARRRGRRRSGRRGARSTRGDRLPPGEHRARPRRGADTRSVGRDRCQRDEPRLVSGVEPVSVRPHGARSRLPRPGAGAQAHRLRSAPTRGSPARATCSTRSAWPPRSRSRLQKRCGWSRHRQRASSGSDMAAPSSEGLLPISWSCRQPPRRRPTACCARPGATSRSSSSTESRWSARQPLRRSFRHGVSLPCLSRSTVASG